MLLSKFRFAILFAGALSLSACGPNADEPDSVDVNVHFEDARGLDQGSKVEFGGVTIGEVLRVVEGDDDVTVELRLDADKAGVVQKNAAAVVSSLDTNTVRIVNPAGESSNDAGVSNGDSLRGLESSLEEAAWHAGKAIGLVEGVLQEAARSFNNYLQSDEWQNTRKEVETGLNELSEQSVEAAESIRENVEQMMTELEAQSGETVRDAEKHFGEIEKQFRELSESGGEEMIKSLESFLESLREAMQTARQQQGGKIDA